MRDRRYDGAQLERESDASDSGIIWAFALSVAFWYLLGWCAHLAGFL